jgi:hypothetical protein
MKALRIIFAIEAAILVLVVGLVLHSEGHKRFPPTVAVVLPTSSPRAILPVSIDLGSRGSTKTSTVRLVTRGGRAKAAPSKGDAGIVGFRPATVKHAPRSR